MIKQFITENLIIRILWITAYIISISLFSYYGYGIYVKWQLDPDISINIRTLPTHEVPFPAVTFCSPYIVSDEAANYTDFRMKVYLNELLPEYSDKEQNLLSTMLEICTSNLEEGARRLKKRTEPSIIKLINKTRSLFENTNGFCGLQTINYLCTRMFNIIPTDMGLCYSFNMQGYNTIFNKGVLSDDFDFYRRKTIVKALNTNSKLYNQTVDDDNETIYWTLQDGYLSSTIDSIPYRSSKQIMSMYLGIKNLNFFKCFGSFYQVSLHLPNEVPTLSNNIAYVNFSASTRIEYEAKSIKHSMNMKKYPPETRQCFFDSEKQLKYFKTYTTANCNLECLTNYTVQSCGCARFYMPRFSGIRVCELSDIACTANAYRNINVYKTKVDQYDIPCNCLPPCNDIKYTIKTKTAGPISESNPIIAIMRKHNYTEPTIIEVATGSIEFQEQEHFVSYSLENFIADVGGLLGLFMGYSFLTIAEFIQKCIKYFCEHRRARLNEVQVAPRNIA